MSVFYVREIERKADSLGKCEVISCKENNHLPYVWLTGFANWLSSRFLRIKYCKTMWRSWGRLSHCVLHTWFNPLLSSSKRGCFDGKLMALARHRPQIYIVVPQVSYGLNLKLKYKCCWYKLKLKLKFQHNYAPQTDSFITVSQKPMKVLKWNLILHSFLLGCS